jgi:proteasome assembly chaperone (PAC2) family protein
MDKAYLRSLSNPTLENPTFVQGLPGFGNVGRIAAHLLIKFFEAKPFAELYSPSFPDYVSINSKGICHLPRYEFYYAPMEKNNLVIMTGEIQPSFDDVVAHYQVCDEVIDFVETLGCHFIITMGGIPITEEKAQIYIAATSPRLAAEFMEKGAVIYSKGRIVGGTGLTLALAKERKLEGVSLLGTTTGFKADREAGFLVFKFLMKALGKEIKEGLGQNNAPGEKLGEVT